MDPRAGQVMLLVTLVGLLCTCGGSIATSSSTKDASPNQAVVDWSPACLSSKIPVLLSSGTRPEVYQLFADQGYVYWGERAFDKGPAIVARVRTSGGPVEQFAQVQRDQGDFGLALGREFIAVVTDNVKDQFFLIRRADRSVISVGGWLNIQMPLFAIDANAAYVTTGGFDITAVPFDGEAPRVLARDVGYQSFIGAVDGTHAFGFGHVGMFSLPLAGGDPTPIGPVGASYILGIDATDIYFRDGKGISRMPKSGGATTSLVAVTDITGPNGMVLDDTSVFWTGTNGISRVPKVGGPPETMVAGGGFPIAVDESCLYWFDGTGLWSLIK